MMQKDNLSPAVIVDLDGTIFSINTFEYYVSFLLKVFMRKVRLITVFKILFWGTARKLRIISHSCLKYHILLCTNKKVPFDELSVFVNSLFNDFLNGFVVNKKDRFESDDYKSCLSTAAPEIYAGLISERLVFDYSLCTGNPFVEKNWFENTGKKKAENTVSFLKKNGAFPDILITDHYDDLPLMKEVRKVILVNPSSKTKVILDNNGIPYDRLL